MVKLPYEPHFKEYMITTKAKAIQMNELPLEIWKKEIEDILKKKLIAKSNSLCSHLAFYVENAAELEKRVPRLDIKNKPLNHVLRWISILYLTKKTY